MNIGFFGCSFTEGGGLNSPTLNKWAIENNIVPKEYKAFGIQNENPDHPNCVRLQNNYRFSSLVGRELKCDTENFGVSRGSNETILNKLYENYERFDICVVQFTQYHRKRIYDVDTDKFYDINGVERQKVPSGVLDFWGRFVTDYYSKPYEVYKITQLINLYDKIFESLDKKVIWMFHDTIPFTKDIHSNIKIHESKNILYFEPKGHLHEFVEHNELTFTHETDGVYVDGHFSFEGNRVIANRIVEKINE